MDKITTNLVSLFRLANQKFIKQDLSLILTNVNERTLCGSLSQHLNSTIQQSVYKNYHVDVEYNRNNGKVKTLLNDKFEVVTINPDIIVHSRGEILKNDNLIAIEMKKSTSSDVDKHNDKVRLIALTKDSYDGVWSFDGVTLPEHVCGYSLGIYYEINLSKHSILLEYYVKGKSTHTETLSFASL